MCKACWKDRDSPSNDSVEIRWAVWLISLIYTDNSVGMPLHTALDDWNIEGTWEPWSEHKSTVSPLCWEAAVKLCEIMNKLNVADRASALARSSGYVI